MVTSYICTYFTYLLSAKLSETLKRSERGQVSLWDIIYFQPWEIIKKALCKDGIGPILWTLSNDNSSMEVISAEELFNNSKVTTTLIVDLKDYQNKDTRKFVQQLIYQPNLSDQQMIIFSSTPSFPLLNQFHHEKLKIPKNHTRKRKNKKNPKLRTKW